METELKETIQNLLLQFMQNMVTILFSALTRMFPKPTFAP